MSKKKTGSGSNAKRARNSSAKKRRKTIESSVAVVFWLEHVMEAVGKLPRQRRIDLARLIESFDWLQRF
jgi:hypothetical protein